MDEFGPTSSKAVAAPEAVAVREAAQSGLVADRAPGRLPKPFRRAGSPEAQNFMRTSSPEHEEVARTGAGRGDRRADREAAPAPGPAERQAEARPGRLGEKLLPRHQNARSRSAEGPLLVRRAPKDECSARAVRSERGFGGQSDAAHRAGGAAHRYARIDGVGEIVHPDFRPPHPEAGHEARSAVRRHALPGFEAQRMAARAETEAERPSPSAMSRPASSAWRSKSYSAAVLPRSGRWEPPPPESRARAAGPDDSIRASREPGSCMRSRKPGNAS